MLVHPMAVGGLSLLAAFGRALQLGAFGRLAQPWSLLLELVVEPARIALFLLVLGDGKLRAGFLSLRRGLTSEHASARFDAGVAKLRSEWKLFAKSLVAFALVAVGLNVGIDIVSAEPQRFEPPLQFDTSATHAERQLAVELGLKNLSVIPLTIVYMVMLLRILGSPSRED